LAACSLSFVARPRRDRADKASEGYFENLLPHLTIEAPRGFLRFNCQKLKNDLE